MSRFRLKLMSGDCYFISDETAQKISTIQAKGLVFISELNAYINLSSVESIVSEEKIDRSNLKEGWLNDGTKVVKRFGSWVDAENPNVRLDYSYYPELAIDEVLTYNPKEEKILIDNKKPLELN